MPRAPISPLSFQRSHTTAFLASCGLVFLVACGSQGRPPAPPLQVGVLAVTQADVPLTHEWVGTLDGFVNAEIRPQVEGYLLRQVYKEGTALRPGQVLVEIDGRPFAAAAQQARAALVRDQAQFDKAKQDVDRFTPLAAEKAISQQELDNARVLLRQAQANVDASQAAVDRATLNLQWTHVTSPHQRHRRGRQGAGGRPGEPHAGHDHGLHRGSHQGLLQRQ